MAVDWNKPVQVRVEFIGKPAPSWINALAVIPLQRGEGDYALVAWDVEGERHQYLFEADDDGIRNNEAVQLWVGIMERKDGSVYTTGDYPSEAHVRGAVPSYPGRLIATKLVYEREVQQDG